MVDLFQVTTPVTDLTPAFRDLDACKRGQPHPNATGTTSDPSNLDSSLATLRHCCRILYAPCCLGDAVWWYARCEGSWSLFNVNTVTVQLRNNVGLEPHSGKIPDTSDDRGTSLRRAAKAEDSNISKREECSQCERHFQVPLAKPSGSFPHDTNTGSYFAQARTTPLSLEAGI